MHRTKTAAVALAILLACAMTPGVSAQSCTATAPCGDGVNTVSCNGTTSCTVYTHSVVCNGRSYSCPGCYAYCQNDPNVYCYSHTNQCNAWFDNPTFTYWISCSGSNWSCPDCGMPWCG
jgi:hypothetical protein